MVLSVLNFRRLFPSASFPSLPYVLGLFWLSLRRWTFSRLIDRREFRFFVSAIWTYGALDFPSSLICFPAAPLSDVCCLRLLVKLCRVCCFRSPGISGGSRGFDVSMSSPGWINLNWRTPVYGLVGVALVIPGYMRVASATARAVLYAPAHSTSGGAVRHELVA